MSGRTDRLLRWGAGLFLVAFGFLPIVAWVPGGHDGSLYLEPLIALGPDIVLVLGVGLILAIASRPVPGLWRPALLEGAHAACHRHPGRTALALGLVSLGLYGVIAIVVFSGKPLSIDELLQVWHGRILASGRLWIPVPELPEFSRTLHMVDLDGRRFSQFPIGGPAMLALGTLVGAEWLVGPVFGALSVMLAWQLVRRLEPTGGVALGAALTFACAPFTAFLAASHMNHVTVLTWLLVAMVGLERSTRDATAPPWASLVTGLGLGMAATIRPLDAVVFALPAGAWLLARAWRLRQVSGLLLAGLGVAVPVGLLLLANRATTGDPLTFGYQALWGPAHGLGFHTSPLGVSHPPLAGLEMVSRYFLRLQLFLFEAPFPSLLPAAMALLLTPRLHAFDRYLLVTAGLLVGCYAAYWHDGQHLGPRFMYPLLPVLTLWSARFLGALRARHAGIGYRTVVFAAVTACLPLAILNAGLLRAREYRAGQQTSRMDLDGLAVAQGVTGAVVLVRESWGAELIARLWARGISASDTEVLYRWVDTCLLTEAVSALEREGVAGAEALARLQPLLSDAGRVVRSGSTEDPTLMALPGARYTPTCLRYIAEDRRGFSSFTPFILSGESGNLILRDLRGHRDRIGRLTAGRRTYLLRPTSAETAAPLRLLPY